jgi:hypothetical protein
VGWISSSVSTKSSSGWRIAILVWGTPGSVIAFLILSTSELVIVLQVSVDLSVLGDIIALLLRLSESWTCMHPDARKMVSPN